MKTRPTKLAIEAAAWKARALAAEATIEAMAVEVRESWRGQRALADYQQRQAQLRERAHV